MAVNLILGLSIGFLVGMVVKKSLSIAIILFLILVVSSIIFENIRISMINLSGLEEVAEAFKADFELGLFINSFLNWIYQSIIVIFGLIPGFLLGILKA